MTYAPVELRTAPEPQTVVWEALFDPSRAVQCILGWTWDCLEAEARGGSPAMLLEALAQACGLHARACRDFGVHAALAAMTDVALRPAAPGRRVLVRCQAATQRAVQYAVEADFLARPCQVTVALSPAAEPQAVLAQRFQCLLRSSPNSPSASPS